MLTASGLSDGSLDLVYGGGGGGGMSAESSRDSWRTAASVSTSMRSSLGRRLTGGCPSGVLLFDRGGEDGIASRPSWLSFALRERLPVAELSTEPMEEAPLSYTCRGARTVSAALECDDERQ